MCHNNNVQQTNLMNLQDINSVNDLLEANKKEDDFAVAARVLENPRAWLYDCVVYNELAQRLSEIEM